MSVKKTTPEITTEEPSAIVIEATSKQRMASDPAVSAWVGASAGSGKTKVLTDRLLRLLLPREDGQAGTKSEKILALTFTKAGANEMALRLSDRLSEWAITAESTLIPQMEELLGHPPSRVEISAARQLFASVVDAPGGLKIMTIHSFCQSILGRFPLEAGLAPNFKALEEDEAQALLEQAKRNIFGLAGEEAHGDIGRAIRTLGALNNEDGFMALLKNISSERRQLRDSIKRSFGTEGLYTKLCAYLGVKPGLNEEQALMDFCRLSMNDEAGLRSVLSVMAESSKKKDLEKINPIQMFLDASPEARGSFYNPYKRAFLNLEGSPYKDPVTQFVIERMPEAADILTKESERILAYEELQKGMLCTGATRDLFLLGQAIVEEYERLKKLQGALDFDDLILFTLSLLQGHTKQENIQNVPAWVMYKLDEGIEHILLDEAQDTNPEQWDIIRLLCDEFFSGLGTRENTARTLFVVGDEKQSIFSFQRAAPEKFEGMKKYFAQKVKNSGQTFREIGISTSFRSSQTILDAVDAVFSHPLTAKGLGEIYPKHTAKREGQAGIVEIWPIFKSTMPSTQTEEGTPETEAVSKGWIIPDKIVESQSGASQMAQKIGDTIKNWIENGEILESYARPIKPSDIMILVRSRGAFVAQMVRALKTRSIPVSGVDRMILSDQIVVQDLCTTASFGLLPEDDLNLACLLKSPFIGMQEEDLYALSYNREGSLWDKVRKNGDRLILNWLETIISSANSLHPYEFFSDIVQQPCPADAHNGMRSIRTRLGDEAVDPLEEFLNTALAYESTHTPSLQEFLKAQEQEQRQIKREMEKGGGTVRIMTVHGAKGLQAPIVFLPDTIRTSSGSKQDSILWPQKTGEDFPLYIPSKGATPSRILGTRMMLEDKADEEYRRLLYVAMTRAEERLYIGGYINKKAPGENSKTPYWYDDIRTALEKEPAVQCKPSGIQGKNGHDMPILTLSSPRTRSPDNSHKNQEDPAVTKPSHLPDWLNREAPLEPSPPTRLIPSRPSGTEPAAISPLSIPDTYRFQRGRASHRLLQTLPEIPKEQQRMAGEKFLARSSPALPPDLQIDILNEVMSILSDPVFGDIFGPGSMAEIPVTGLLKDGRLISGQIDRMLVRDEDVLIIDYKTNRPPPQNPADVPVIYKTQMKAYADTLRMIYPDKTIRCALLWTDGARLMEISG